MEQLILQAIATKKLIELATVVILGLSNHMFSA